MNDWTAGYVADVGYTYGYYSELNPLRLKLAFLNAGLAVPDITCACELGFGQGISINVHAAASEVSWTGTDFNPSQAAFANELSSICGNGANLTDEAFEEFCSRPDLPDFNYIGLHGIWSWISNDNRQIIADFIKRKLKVGGVLYVSYNTLPGWSSFAPVRHLMTEHAARFGSNAQGIVKQIDEALDFGAALSASDAKYVIKTPGVKDRIEQLKKQDRNYLAHEYFNKDWHPMYFSDVANWLSEAKLDFACSAHYLDAVDALNLSPEQIKLMATVPDKMYLQTLRDFCTNQQFRRDYWVKGSRRMTALERMEKLRAECVVLTVPIDRVPEKISGSHMEATLQKSIYDPILSALKDHRPVSIGELETSLEGSGVKFKMLIEAIMILIGSGSVSPAISEPPLEAIAKSSKLNRHTISLARSNSDMRYLASPITAGAVIVPRFQQLFILAILEGHTQPEKWAEFVWGILNIQGQKIIKDGKSLESDDANLAELKQQAVAFKEQDLKILRRLKVIDGL